MSKLTLDEAIKHCLEVAEKNDAQAEKWREEGGEEWGKTTACRECATDHRQLAEWLTELKQWRRVYSICPSYEMCIPECKEGYDAQIAEYERLLKAAVEDFSEVKSYLSEPYSRLCDKWRYADEAEKLLND